MKKFGLFLVAIIAAFIFLGNLGSIIMLAVTLGILYFAVKGFLAADSTTGKVLWGAVAAITLFVSIGNVPALIGLVALFVLYYLYKQYKEEKEVTVTEDSDPFSNFEKEWDRLNKKY